MSKRIAAVVFFLIFANMSFAGSEKIRRFPDGVKGEYIVVLKEKAVQAVRGTARSLAASYGGELIFIYDYALGGFAIRLSDEAAQRMASDPRVDWIEEDQRTQVIDYGISASRSVGEASLWHVDRTDQRYETDGWYSYCSAGYGTTAYVLDMGVQASHPEFKVGQVKAGPNFTGYTYAANNPCQDIPISIEPEVNLAGSHGTAVAMVLAGQTTGVAPDTTIVPVAVVNCYGQFQKRGLLAGMNWIIATTQDSQYGQPVNPDVLKRPALVNISWGVQTGTFYEAGVYGSVEVMANDLINNGITVITSANNYTVGSQESTDACTEAPANMGRGETDRWVSGTSRNGAPTPVLARVITVGGTELQNVWSTSEGRYRKVDYRWSGPVEASKFGSCVSIWAPARDIKVGDQYGRYYVSSGTSFAAPLVAGLVSRYLFDVRSTSYPHFDARMPDMVWSFLLQNSTTTEYNSTAAIPRNRGTDSPSRFAHRYEVATGASCRTRPVSNP